MELVTGISGSYSRTVLPVPLVHFWRNALFCRVPVQAVGFMVLFGSGSVSGSGSKADLLRQNV